MIIKNQSFLFFWGAKHDVNVGVINNNRYFFY